MLPSIFRSSEDACRMDSKHCFSASTMTIHQSCLGYAQSMELLPSIHARVAACPLSCHSSRSSFAPTPFLSSSRVLESHSRGILREIRIRASANSSALVQEEEDRTKEPGVPPGATCTTTIVHTKVWKWQQHNIRYQLAGIDGPALVLIHGFGANSDHWRKNISSLARSHRVYAIDLLGYGFSDKPNPRDLPPNSLYTFETWAKQVLQFCEEVVEDRAFLICNSIGGIVGLQAALMEPRMVRGLLLLNISLRLLHNKKQPWYARPFVKALQYILRTTELGRLFFKSIATPQAVKRILCECYHDDSAVTDELVDKILQPGLQPGAVDVFLDFLCYSGGPLPEELLPQVTCPVLLGWGEKDPWEPLTLGRAFGQFPSVEEFVVLPNVGHCPQDEAPHLVNPLVERFVSRHATVVSSE